MNDTTSDREQLTREIAVICSEVAQLALAWPRHGVGSPVEQTEAVAWLKSAKERLACIAADLTWARFGGQGQ